MKITTQKMILIIYHLLKIITVIIRVIMTRIILSSLIQKTSKTVNVIINQIMQINFTAAQFLADHNQNN